MAYVTTTSGEDSAKTTLWHSAGDYSDRHVCLSLCLSATLRIVTKRCEIGLYIVRIEVELECDDEISVGTIFDPWVHHNPPNEGFELDGHNLTLELRKNGDRQSTTLY